MRNVWRMSGKVGESVEWYGADLCAVPASHLCSSPERDKLAGASLVNHTLFLTLVEELLLSWGEGDSWSNAGLLLVLYETNVFHPRVDLFVTLAIEETWPENGPRRHQKLLLVRFYIDNAVFMLHQMLKARCSIEHGRDRHWYASEAFFVVVGELIKPKNDISN